MRRFLLSHRFVGSGGHPGSIAVFKRDQSNGPEGQQGKTSQKALRKAENSIENMFVPVAVMLLQRTHLYRSRGGPCTTAMDRIVCREAACASTDQGHQARPVDARRREDHRRDHSCRSPQGRSKGAW